MNNKDILQNRIAVNEVLKLAENLINFLAKETTALRERRVADFSRMQEEKFQLIAHYEQRLAQLRTKIEEGFFITEEDKKHLENTMTQVRHVVMVNKRALTAMNEANNRLVAAVIKAVKEKNQENCRYDRKGIRFFSEKNRQDRKSVV